MSDERNQPLSGNAMPRFAGPGTMMRLPAATSSQGLDAAFIGVPLDIGTSNRAGARFGPRQIRAESSLLRPYNMATGAAPFDTLQVADLGDVPINTYSLEKSLSIITHFYDDVIGAGCRPLTLGGDHTIALPILRAIARKHGPVALVHVDAHADVNDEMFGEGVETIEQESVLQGWGCDVIQGFLRFRPAPADTATGLLEKDKQDALQAA